MRYQVRAVNDERDFCQCCGKENLKRVVWIEDTETNEVRHFGTTCATAPAKGFGVDKQIKQAIDAWKRTQQVIGALAHRLYRERGGKYVSNGDCCWSASNMSLFNACLSEVKTGH